MIDLDELRDSGRVDESIEGNGGEIESGNPWGLPFDPAETGPLDLLGAGIARIESRLVETIAALAILGVIYAYLAVAHGIEPSIPTWVWVSILGGTLAVILTAYPLKKLIDWLWTEETHVLVDLNPRSGDISVWELSGDKWSELTVLDRRGVERELDYLHEIRLRSGGGAHEVDGYSPEQNVAVGSWMAGAQDRDIRRHERMVNIVKRRLSQEAEISVDELINAPEAIRQVGGTVVRELVSTAERIETPTHDRIGVELAELGAQTDEEVSKLLDSTEINDPDAVATEESDEEEEEITIADVLSTPVNGSGSGGSSS